MRILYDKHKGKLVRLRNGVVGVVCGFTHNHFLLSVDDINIVSCFTLEDLANEDYFIEQQYLEEDELGLFMYCDESQILR